MGFARSSAGFGEGLSSSLSLSLSLSLSFSLSFSGLRLKPNPNPLHIRPYGQREMGLKRVLWREWWREVIFARFLLCYMFSSIRSILAITSINEDNATNKGMTFPFLWHAMLFIP